MTGTGRADRLQAFIEATAGEPAVWGRDGSDCTSWPTKWVEGERGIRLPLPAYSSEEEGRALIEARGGLEPLWRGALADAGIYETSNPQLGDVGLVRMSWGASGCIFGLAGIAFFRGRIGVSALGPRRNTIIAAWSI